MPIRNSKDLYGTVFIAKSKDALFLVDLDSKLKLEKGLIHQLEKNYEHEF